MLSFRAVSAAGLFLVLLCYLVRRRGAEARRRRHLVRRPILGVDLATHHAIPFDERLPYFPAPAPTELANLDTRLFHSLRPPSSPVINRRQFPAPGSPNQQLLSPRQRQSAQRRLPYEYPLPPSLPSTPALPFPATPPRSPALGLAHYRSRLSSTAHADGSVQVEHPAYSPSTLAAGSVLANSRLLLGPPRSPLVRESPPPASPFQTRPVPEISRPSTCTGLGLPIELLSPCPVRASLPLPTIPPAPVDVVSRTQSPAVPVSPSPAPFLLVKPAPHRHLVRRSPSVPLLPALSPIPRIPAPPDVAPSSGKKTKKKKNLKKRHSTVICATASPPGSPTISAIKTPPALPSREGPPDEGHSAFATEDEHAQVDVTSTADGQSNSRILFSDMHNTAIVASAPTTKQEDTRGPLETPPPCPPSRIDLVALVSPSKAPRRLDRGPNPVYCYDPDAPAVVVAKSIARPAQDEFKNFSAGLGAKFGMRGWAETGPNELAPPKKSKKKKKKVVATAAQATPCTPSFGVPEPGLSRPPSPRTGLLPSFEYDRADPATYLDISRPKNHLLRHRLDVASGN